MLSWQNILNNRQIAADIEKKLANHGEVLPGGISEIVNNYGLKRETVWQIVRFISHFSLKLYIQF